MQKRAIRILFVCYGNICRSPMAECIMTHLLRSARLTNCEVASRAISNEEEGNDIYPSAARKLRAEGVPILRHASTQLKKSDYALYDLVLGMESSNVRSIIRIFGGDPEGKVKRLLDFCDNPHDIADPWWTGDYDAAYRDIYMGCEALIAYLTGSIV